MNRKKSTRPYYGWYVVGIGMLALLVSNGLSIGGIPVFYKFVQTDLVATGAVAQENIQTVYGIAPALTFVFAGLFSPVAGFLLHRFNPRAMMITGCLLLGSGLAVYSQAATAATVYIAHSILGMSLGFVGVLVCTVLVSNWFVRKRGLALGMLLTGTSLGGALISQIATPLISEFGWRAAINIVSLLVWLVLLPAVIFLVKNRPSEIGRLPDGDDIDESGSCDFPKTNADISGFTFVEAVKTPHFWIFSFTAALIFYAIFVVTQQLNLYLQGQSIGFTSQQAAQVQSLLFIFSIFGKFLYGLLSDHMPIARVMLISAATMFISTLAFLYFDTRTVYFFAILFGLNYGGTFVLLQLLAADYFGLKEYGRILGVVTVIETMGGASGTIITGRMADAAGGDYSRAFLGVIVVTGISLVLVIILNLIYRKAGNAVL